MVLVVKSSIDKAFTKDDFDISGFIFNVRDASEGIEKFTIKLDCS